MLCTSAVFLCLVCFWQNFIFLQCRSTGRVSEYNHRADLTGRCLRSCFLETSSRETCFEKCLGRKNGDKLEFRGKTGSSTSQLQLVTPLSRRRKRSTDLGNETSPCPNDVFDDINIYPTIRKVERNQYENSNTSYVNISWNPIDEGVTNFTSYLFVYWYDDMGDDPSSRPTRYIERQKNETYMVYPESKYGWNYNMSFFFNVIALPCLSGTFDMKNLDDYLSASQATVSPSNKTPIKTTDIKSTDWNITGTVRIATASPSNKTAINTTATVSPSNKTAMNTTALVTIAIGSLVLIVTIAYLLRRKYSHSNPEKEDRILPTGFKYDAFIIFNIGDQAWVNGTLLRILEKKHGFKCCVHYRDFKPGGLFIDTICDSVQISRKTIAVVSENFFKGEYCAFELNKAIQRQVTNNDNSIIVIRKDRVSNDKLPPALKDRSFIDYSNLVERKSWISKLIKALESNRNEESLRSNNEDNCVYTPV